jgi:hypothetical protein
VWYDITNFTHPGDGICCLYLSDYYEKDITEEFESRHYTDLPYEIIETVTENGECDGIKLF